MSFSSKVRASLAVVGGRQSPSSERELSVKKLSNDQLWTGTAGENKNSHLKYGPLKNVSIGPSVCFIWNIYSYQRPQAIKKPFLMGKLKSHL